MQQREMWTVIYNQMHWCNSVVERVVIVHILPWSIMTVFHHSVLWEGVEWWGLEFRCLTGFNFAKLKVNKKIILSGKNVVLAVSAWTLRFLLVRHHNALSKIHFSASFMCQKLQQNCSLNETVISENTPDKTQPQVDQSGSLIFLVFKSGI